MALLEVDRLQTHFRTPDGVNRAVDGVSFHVEAGETLAIVGESGCGKSVTAMSILRLIPEPPGKMAGAIRFNGRNLLELSDREMRDIRGNDISMIFQEPMTSLNPVLTVGRQIGETLQLHQGMPRRRAEARAVEMLQLVGIPEPGRRVREYPHQLSGGMRQRVMIAIALACNPKLLIADEPTTALDVTIQAQILELLADLRRRERMAMLLITHDLQIVRRHADRVVVMNAGRIVETGETYDIFANPQDPVTRSFLSGVTGTVLPGFIARRITPDGTGPAILRITFAGDSATHPVLSRLGAELGIDASILGGAIEEIDGRPFGNLTVQMPAEALPRAQAYLHAHDLRTEVLGHVG